jgi:hypothetical protein
MAARGAVCVGAGQSIDDAEIDDQSGARKHGSAFDADVSDIFHGITRHSPEGMAFKRRAEAVGWKQAVNERDLGTYDWTADRPINQAEQAKTHRTLALIRAYLPGPWDGSLNSPLTRLSSLLPSTCCRKASTRLISTLRLTIRRGFRICSSPMASVPGSRNAKSPRRWIKAISSLP